MTELVDEIVKRVKDNKQYLTEGHIKVIKEHDLKNLRKEKSVKTREERIRKLILIAASIRKEFHEMTEDGIQVFVDELREKNLERCTIETYKYHLRNFFEGTSLGDAECIKFIKFKYKYKSSRDVLSEEEVLQLVECADGIRNKATLMVLWETGCRVGELVSCDMADYIQVGEHVKLVLTGKTGTRERELVMALPYMQRYIEQHPHKGKPDKPLFISKNHLRFNERITRDGVVEIIKQAKEKAGIQKRITPHIFRHSRASYLAPFLNEMEMRLYFGWTKDSTMPAIYIHLSGKQVNDKYRGVVTGEKKELEPKRSVFLERKCPRCGEMNVSHAIYCFRCYMPIDSGTVNRDIKITEAFKSPYVQEYLKIDVDKIVDEFYYFRDYINEILQFKKAFRGCKKMSLYQLRENLGWTKQKFDEFINWVKQSKDFQFDEDGTVTLLEFKDPESGKLTTFFGSFEWLNDTLIQGRKK